MTRKPFRSLRALLGAFPRRARAASKSAFGGWVWLTPLLLGPACALALDIGEIQVHSALNQLFDARIPLPALTPEELGKVSVKLAPASMFKEFDLERAPTLTNLVFSIEYNAEGQVYVKVISTKPIQEPSLGLLVEFGWPRGKTFREFTIFLDPVQRLAQRPGERSKTVLDAPAAASAPPLQPVPPTVAATPALQQDIPADGSADPLPAAVATITATEAVEASGTAPLSVEAAPAPVRIYRPGDTYGPVAVGEGLWGIALKVRPDPAITREQMIQALFQANPHAFSKAGISGLKTGVMLRLPSFREIADITGSTTARHLAGIEQTAAVTATPPSPPSGTTESPVSKAVTGIPEVFPLESPAPLEPIATTTAPAAPALEPEGAVAVSAAPPSDVPTEPVLMVEPVSVTPLLFLAISEMVAAVAQPPAMAVSEAEVVTPKPKQEASATPEPSVVVSAVEAPAPVSTATPEPPVAFMDTATLLAAVEKHSPRMERDLLLQAYLVSDVSVPMGATFTESLPRLAMPANVVALSSAVVGAEVSAPAVLDSPRLLAAGPVEPSVKAVEPPPRSYKGGDQYGPIAPNERLSDIAIKVRPDPGISREHMMKSLLKANPQAFFKSNNMNSLKVGATLRIPTLQEIVDYTGSKAANQLLKQRQTVETPPAPEPAAVPSAPEPAAVPSAPEPAAVPSAPEPAAVPPAPEPAAVPPAPEPAAVPPAPEPAAETPPVGKTSPAN